MLGEEVLMAPGQGFHLRGLQCAARAFGEIREVHSGTPSLCARPLFEAREASIAARPMRDRSTPDPQMVRCSNGFKSLKPLGYRPERVSPISAGGGLSPSGIRRSRGR